MLHIFAILLVSRLTFSAPIDSFALLSNAEDIDSENYDIIIDQRQNGTQNFRIKVSGLNIAIPDDREPSDSASAPSLEQFATLLSTQSGSNQHHGSDLAAFFDWKKSSKGSDKKKSDDTQSRTKDIPTDSQLADENSRFKIKEIVQDEQRKYKLLVGERFIVPFLRFLKKQTEDVRE